MAAENWWNDYLGLPYLANGRERSGLDCWGLVRLVHAEQFGIDLPSLSGTYVATDREQTADLIAANSEGWAITKTPQAGDVVLFRIMGAESHVGIVTRPGYFLHVREDQDSVVERLESGTWKHRVAGIYRYAGEGATVGVSAVAHPLRTVRIDAQMMQGLTLEQMAAVIRESNGVSTDLSQDALMAIDGEHIPRDQWAMTTPRVGQMVEYRATVRGSGAGKMLGMLAVAVAVFAFQQYYLAPMLAGAGFGTVAAGGAITLTAGGMAMSAAAGIALNMAGSMLLNAIFPTRAAASADTSGPRSMAMLQGGSNSANKYGSIPVVLGRYRYTPPLGAETYVETGSTTSYLRMLLVWGYGPLQVSDLRIGDTPLSSFDEVEHETLAGYGYALESPIRFNSLYASDVEQLSPGVTLLQADGYTTRTLSSEVDRITVSLNFPEGLFRLGQKNGKTLSSIARVSIGVRQVGQSWSDASQAISETWGTLPPAWYNIDSDADIEAVFRWTRISLSKTNQIIIRHGGLTDNVSANPSSAMLARLQGENYGMSNVFTRFPDIGPSEEALWDICMLGPNVYTSIDRRGSSGLGSVSGCMLDWVSGPNFHLSPGSIVRAQGAGYSIWKTTKDAFSQNFSFNVPHGLYEVRVMRTNTDEPNSGDTHYNTCVLQTITGYSNGRPVSPPKPLAMTAIRIKATNQLNGSVEGITGTVTSICLNYIGSLVATYTSADAGFTDYYTANDTAVTPGTKIGVDGLDIAGLNGTFTVDSTGFTGGVGYRMRVLTPGTSVPAGSYAAGGRLWIAMPTRNPASLMRYVLQHPGNAKRVSDSKINLIALADFHNFCRSNGFMFDHVMTGTQSLDDVLRDICAAGRASPTRVDGLHTVIIDRPRSSYAQFFTPHNSWGFEGARMLPVLPHAFRVTFANSAKGYQPDELIVYNDGYSAANASLFEGISQPGVSSDVIAHKHARFHLAQLKLRPETYALNADIEHLVCTRGDLVKVAHDVPMWGLGTGRIAERVSSTVIRVSEDWPMDAGVQYTIRIRLANGSSITRTVASVAVDGYYDTLTLTASVSTLQAAPDNLCMFGSLNEESVDLIVQSIEPSENMSARITLVDYSPAVYDSDDEVIPPFDSQITKPPTLLLPTITAVPTVTRIASDETAMTRVSPGKYSYAIRASFTSPKTMPISVTHIEGQIDFAEDDTDDWQGSALVLVKSGAITFADVQEGDVYRFRLRYVDSAGRTGPWSALQTHTVTGRANPPSSVAGLAIKVSGSRLLLDWSDAEEVDVTRYEVRTENANWGVADSRRVYFGGSSSCYFTPTLTGVYTLYVKARDDAAHWSATAASVSYDYFPPEAPLSLSATFSDTSLTEATITLDWPDLAPAFGLSHYIVSYEDVVKTAKASVITLPANWIGDREFSVQTVDNLGNPSDARTRVVTKRVPGQVTGTRVQVLDNNVLIYWTLPKKTTLPIAHIRMKVGADWATAADIGTKSGSFTSLSEVLKGEYVYWLAAVDTDGYESDPVSVRALVSEPPDFVFHGTLVTAGFSGTKTSAVVVN